MTTQREIVESIAGYGTPIRTLLMSHVQILIEIEVKKAVDKAEEDVREKIQDDLEAVLHTVMHEENWEAAEQASARLRKWLNGRTM